MFLRVDVPPGYCIIPVPHGWTANALPDGRYEVSGVVQDMRQVKITFTLFKGELARKCVKREHWSDHHDRKFTHATQCNTDWILRWLASNAGGNRT